MNVRGKDYFNFIVKAPQMNRKPIRERKADY